MPLIAAVLALAVGAGCASGPAGPQRGGGSGHASAAAAITAPPGGVRAGLHGHGELAFVAHGALFLTGGPAGALRRVSLPAPPSSPAWSPDHRWLAVEVSMPPVSPDYQPGPASLWVMSAAGTGARRVSAANWDVTGFAWSPRSDLLAVAVSLNRAPAGQSAEVVTVTVRGARRVLAAASYVSGVAWAPDGRRVAAGVSVVTSGHGGRSRLELLSPAGGRAEIVTASRGNGLDLAGWWPAGARLLYWTDPGSSASIAADGLPLDTVPLAGQRPTRLAATMLVHGSWLALSPGGRAVAAVAGGYRVIWSGHKHLVICRPGGCAAVPQPPDVVSLDPAWSPDGGTLAFARASAAGPFGPRGHAGFSPSWIRRWQATSRLWLANRSGSGLRPLRAAGRGALAPVWGTDGSLLFVRDDRVWLLPRGAARPTRVTGPLGALAGQVSYGYVPYPQLIAWTLARPFATAGTG